MMKSMSASSKGMAKELLCKKALMALGYQVERRIRGRFTHDFFDLYDIIGMHPEHGWKLCQVTTNVNKPPAFREMVKNHHVPVGTSKEIWIYKDRVKEPIIHLFNA